jgi:hypothetical protein
MHQYIKGLILISGFIAWSQQEDSLYRTKKFAVSDTIKIDQVSINPHHFLVQSSGVVLSENEHYSIDFETATLILNKQVSKDSVTVNYLNYPEFMTRTYKKLDEDIIVQSKGNLQQLYKLSQPSNAPVTKLFDGLTTQGSISRGVTIGNSQNAVLNSELDLQISGNLNDNVSIRASIQDANIPLQSSGYSQRLDEFDQVFIEVYSDQWRLRAGDIDLENTNSYFGEFSKRVQGLSIESEFEHHNSRTTAFASGALVRGQFTTSQFTAQEGNQGPYKLTGPNNELFVLIVSGSETVYVNGVALQRGASNDYIIDYNAGELIFNSTYPITSEMRITVDYQYTDRNYSRFVGFSGVKHESDKLNFGVSVYSESDLKNQTLQQLLNDSQKQILAEAGDNNSLMVAPSFSLESYSDNRILYKKILVNGVEVFVFSNNAEDELYRVNFSYVGPGLGDYKILSSDAIDNIYEYIPPLGTTKQGSYAPVIQLVAPVKLQLALINGSYVPNIKTAIDFELAASRNDLNLFSNLDDQDNTGLALKFKWDQNLLTTRGDWKLNSSLNLEGIQKEFRNLEGLYNPEFNRDWNLDMPVGNQIITDLGDQLFLTSLLQLEHQSKGHVTYEHQNLEFGETYSGNRHVISSRLKLKAFEFRSSTSVLTTNATTSTSKFIRSETQLEYSYKKGWSGMKFSIEDNEKLNRDTAQLDSVSQRFRAYELFTGIGDSTKVYVKVGYTNRINDSLKTNQLERVNRSNTYYIDSKLIQSPNSDLNWYANFRSLKFEGSETADQKALNSRLQYSQKLFNQVLFLNTVYETNSGRLAQQDYTYVEVEPGQGRFVWFDYNENGVQELEEFEIAQFQDQATYIRVLLPNQNYIKTHQNRFSQTLTLDPSSWASHASRSKQFWSHFYSQTSFLIDRKDQNASSTLHLNPFESKSDTPLALQSNFRSILYFNRGKQNFTTSYSYGNSNLRNVLSFGYIAQDNQQHQLNFSHKVQDQWLFNLQSSNVFNNSESENFSSKNYELEEFLIHPKISYLWGQNKRFDVFFQLQNKTNTIGDLETLNQQNYGASFSLTQNQNAAVTAEFNYFSNNFKGNPNTPVAYQMMSGLQPGANFTWSLIAQKKLTKFLDLNLNYFGRKSETSRVIHTGNVQFKAYF